jgi:biotin carboxyl carrier protein
MKKLIDQFLDLTIAQILGALVTIVSVSWVAFYFVVISEKPVKSQSDAPALQQPAQKPEEPDKPGGTFTPPATVQATGSTRPRILKFTLTLASPEDLEVREGDRIEAGKTIADRKKERERLQQQRGLLKISLDRIKARTLAPPPAPLPVPEVLPLPDVSYRVEEAALQKVARDIDLQEQKINLLQALDGIPTETERHESLRLENLNEDFATADANLTAAKEARKVQEYENSLTIARRQEEANQQALYYSNQKQEYEAQVRDREFQVAGLQEQIANVEKALVDLTVVTAPYTGTVRRIKWLGQTNNLLQVEVTLAIAE